MGTIENDLSFVDRRNISTFKDLFDLALSDPKKAFKIIHTLSKSTEKGGYSDEQAIHYMLGYMQALLWALSAQLLSSRINSQDIKAELRKLIGYHSYLSTLKVEIYLGPRRKC